MPKLRRESIFPTPEEDAAITAAAESDPDARPLTDEEWELVKPTLRRGAAYASHEFVRREGDSQARKDPPDDC